jgi:thiol-disulfide isomerase/thioredoxin
MKMFLGRIVAATLLASVMPAQKPPTTEAEQKMLREAIAEAGNSTLDFMRVLEQHLTKYPDSPQRDELENAIAKAAVELRDNKRILTYGEKVLARNPNDVQLLDRVSRALLVSDDKESAARALKYSQNLERIMRTVGEGGQGTNNAPPNFSEELDRSIARALVFQARATSNLGKHDEALKLATKSYETYPSAESAREIGRCLVKLGREMEAIPHYADAFTIADTRNTEMERAKDRAKLAELYKKNKNTEAGLGDYVLQAYDRTAALLLARAALAKERDPNADANDPMDFTIRGLDGGKLELSSLRGKVVIMDFWATWCGPCRAQHPLYEEVKKRFADSKDVVFLAINTDEDRDAVAPFLEKQKWSQKVYFEDGLANLLKVSSIPATIVVDKRGKLYSRMNGFLPDRFVDMLTDRIREALKEN